MTSDFLSHRFGGSEKSRFLACRRRRRHSVQDLLGRGVLGDGLGSLTDGVLGQFSGQEQTNSRLDLATRDRRTTVVVSQTGSLGSDALEDVVHKAVHDAHRLRADAGVWVHLLQDLVDVDGVRLSSSPLLLLISGPGGLRLGRGLFRSLRCCCFRWHDDDDALSIDAVCRLNASPTTTVLFICRRPSKLVT